MPPWPSSPTMRYLRRLFIAASRDREIRSLVGSVGSVRFAEAQVAGRFLGGAGGGAGAGRAAVAAVDRLLVVAVALEAGREGLERPHLLIAGHPHRADGHRAARDGGVDEGLVGHVEGENEGGGLGGELPAHQAGVKMDGAPGRVVPVAHVLLVAA